MVGAFRRSVAARAVAARLPSLVRAVVLAGRRSGRAAVAGGTRRRARRGAARRPHARRRTACGAGPTSRERRRASARFFHWPLEFADVFYDETGAPRERPGFDAVIGNPPWEMLRRDERRRIAPPRRRRSDRHASTLAFLRESGALPVVRPRTPQSVSAVPRAIARSRARRRPRRARAAVGPRVRRRRGVAAGAAARRTAPWTRSSASTTRRHLSDSSRPAIHGARRQPGSAADARFARGSACDDADEIDDLPGEDEPGDRSRISGAAVAGRDPPRGRRRAAHSGRAPARRPRLAAPRLDGVPAPGRRRRMGGRIRPRAERDGRSRQFRRRRACP